jgi:hypothetical protein
MSVPKEVHFFNERLVYRNTFMERNYPKGLEWYKKHFKHCARNKIKGEITPRYCIDPLAAERIKSFNKEVKIFYCVRSPVDRIESHYNFARYFVGKEDRPIDQAVREEREFIDMSLYFKNLSLYLRHFPKEQIYLVWFEDIKERPEHLLAQVYSFLGVDTSYRPPKMYEKSNQGRISRFHGLQKFTRRLNHYLVLSGFSWLVKNLKEAGLGSFVMKINSRPLKKDKMSPELKAWVIDQVRDDVHQLEQWTGKDLSHWLQ